MFEIILHYTIFSIVIFSNGLIFQIVLLNGEKIKLNFFEQSIIGLISTGFLTLILNFFFPLNDLFIYINLIVGCIFLLFFKNQINFDYNNNEKIIILLIFILSLVNLYGSGFSDDLHHYHGGHIVNTDNHNYIVGLNFLHHHYGYSSIWLMLHSYLNINGSLLQDIHVLNALIFFVIISYLIIENIRYSKISKNYLLYLISSVFIFFFLIKYTRLKEFGLDRPGILLFCFLIYFAAKYQYLIRGNIKKANKYFFMLFLICLFVSFTKIFLLSCFLVPFFFILKSKNFNFFYNKISLILYLIVFIYFLRNILISGCLVYPFEFTCLSELQWNSKEIASDLLLRTEASTKAFDKYIGPLSAAEYIKNFNWFSTWFLRNGEELFNYIATTVLISVLFILSSKNKKKIKKYSNFEIVIFLLFICNFIIFIKSPVVRYHHILFILFSLCLLIPCKKVFFKKIFIFNIILVICLSFNFGKNLKRIYEGNFYNNPYEDLKKIQWYTPPVEKKLDNFLYYIGWIDAHPIGNMDLKDLKHKKKFGFDIIYK
jgi:hypothetical protein